jgi:antitoxin component YwqK of YwqJK toxin-antitoxin module
MKPFLVCSILLFCFTYVIGQQLNVETTNGHNVFYYPNGQISSEGKMVNGKPDGLWKSFYVDGTQKSIGLLHEGMLDSVWIFYNEKGKIKEKINYLYGKKNGYYYTFGYFKNADSVEIGYLKSQELYLNNKKNGLSDYFFTNGTVRLSVNYVQGIKHGIAREYNREGRLISVIDYRNGKAIDVERINRYEDSVKVGVWKEFYPNGKIKRKMNYTNGELNGMVKEYDLSGELITAHRYEQGMLKDTSITLENEIDIVEEFYNVKDTAGNPIIKKSGGYIEGKPVGVHRTFDSLGRVNSSRLYDSNGNLIGEGIVNVEGDRVGSWKYYYEDGIIKSEGEYKNNRRVGVWKYYYHNGNIEQKGNFLHGVPHGQWIWYYETGNVKREEYYRLGKEDGESVEYDEYGEITAKGNYIEGLKEGKWFFDFQVHIEEGNFKNDFKHGMWNYKYPNGKLYFEGRFIQGNPDGMHLYYYKNGKLKEKQYYNIGIKEKNWEYYDYYGTLIKVRTFDSDKLIKIDGISVETE